MPINKLVLSDIRQDVITLFHRALTQLGQMPYPQFVKIQDLLSGDDILMLVCLSRFLDDAYKIQSYDPLIRGLAAIAEWQAEMKRGP